MTIERSNMELDVIIPLDIKDIGMLHLTVESVRKNLYHPIGNIFVISANNADMRVLCKNHQCAWIDEDNVLPIKLKDINYKVKGKNDRSGWIFQQLLKLSCDNISNGKHVLVMDADTILVRPQVFELNNKMLLLQANEYRRPYYITFEKIFKFRTVVPYSFIAHHMLFSTHHVKLMKLYMEEIHDVPWYKAIIEHLDQNEMSSFSEYETYGNWMMKKFPEKVYVEHFFNCNLAHKGPMQNLDYYCKTYSNRYRSVSIHRYYPVIR